MTDTNRPFGLNSSIRFFSRARGKQSDRRFTLLDCLRKPALIKFTLKKEFFKVLLTIGKRKSQINKSGAKYYAFTLLAFHFVTKINHYGHLFLHQGGDAGEFRAAEADGMATVATCPTKARLTNGLQVLQRAPKRRNQLQLSLQMHASSVQASVAVVNGPISP